VTTPAQRNRFLDDAVATASPARLLTMLYDRLVLDLHRAEAAQVAGDREAAHRDLVHAQSIVAELSSTLDVDAWDGAPRLLSLYGFLLRELVRANISGDAAVTASCRALVEPLRDAWHEASRAAAATPVSATA
jgi:flagellar protein FliS